MKLPFTKMHGLGNDFVVIEALREPLVLSAAQYARLADRRLGIGCDQVLVIERAREADADFYLAIRNADGSAAEQCGNGLRCVARHLVERGFTSRRQLRLSTLGGLFEAEVLDGGEVRVDMGAPRLSPEAIPFVAETRATSYRLAVAGGELEIGAVSLGNPHAVLRVPDVAVAPVAALGPLLEHHARFPQRANVGFMEIVDRGHLRLRVFERGSGETPACGSGACAAVVWGRLAGWLDETVRVSLPGGDLVVSWPGEGSTVRLTGPATTVFEGTIEI